MASLSISGRLVLLILFFPFTLCPASAVSLTAPYGNRSEEQDNSPGIRLGPVLGALATVLGALLTWAVDSFRKKRAARHAANRNDRLLPVVIADAHDQAPVAEH